MIKNIQYRVLGAVLVALTLLVNEHTAQAADNVCPPQKGSVARAMFTTAIKDREPVNQVLILDDKYKKVFFFSDLRNLQGKVIVHRWEHDGQVVSEKSFDIKGPRWRVFSSLTLDPSMIGRWTVIIADKNGCPLKAEVFQYVAVSPDGDGSAILKLK